MRIKYYSRTETRWNKRKDFIFGILILVAIFIFISNEYASYMIIYSSIYKMKPFISPSINYTKTLNFRSSDDSEVLVSSLNNSQVSSLWTSNHSPAPAVSSENNVDEFHSSLNNLTLLISTTKRFGVFSSSYNMIALIPPSPSDSGILRENLPQRSSTKVLENHFFRCHNPFGRLGNWLFQFASAFGIANTLGYRFCIEQTHPLNEHFNINRTCTSKIENIMTLDEKQCRNESWIYDKSYLSHNLTASGFLQSWKYFLNSSQELRNMLSFKPHFLIKARKFLSNLRNSTENRTIIGIHVRRGDFLREIHIKMGYTVASRRYIEHAMAYYKYKAPKALFVVASDDINWCKDNIKDPNVVFSAFTDPVTDLALLTLCDHTMITSGTFSWWAGWLCGGTVVYLKDFPRPGSELECLTYDSKDHYYPKHWIGFNND